jgi:hypothetical protein
MRHHVAMMFRLAAGLCSAALLLTACSSSEPADPPAPSPTSSTSAEPEVERSALTGLEMPDGLPRNPVFVVKIENTSAGAPQYGLNKADLVIEELVEGGLTRLAAFFYSSLPSAVGHVRSLRTSDIGIAAPVGGQIVASGGAAGAYNRVERAGIKVFSEDAGDAGFSSDPAKFRPYNRMINLKTVNKSAKRTKIQGPYLPWNTQSDAARSDPAPGSRWRPATKASVRFSPATTTTWALSKGRWVRTNGHAEQGKDFKADTMIVIEAKIGDAGYRDPAGNPVPETVFEGSGRAHIFHQGYMTRVRWNKPSLEEGLTFSTSAGEPILINPGKVFIELIPRDGGSVAFE